jgi:putative transposase
MRKAYKFRLYPNKTTEQKLFWIRTEYQDIGSHGLQDVLHRLNKAFDHFFRKVERKRAGHFVGNPGYTRFQGRNRYTSFTYPDGAGWKLTVEERGEKFAGTLLLAKIGEAKVKLHRQPQGQIKTVTIKREVDQWYVIFSCQVAEPEKLPASYEDIGIDLGVTHLATLSNGEMIEHPHYTKRARKPCGFSPGLPGSMLDVVLYLC